MIVQDIRFGTAVIRLTSRPDHVKEVLAERARRAEEARLRQFRQSVEAA